VSDESLTWNPFAAPIEEARSRAIDDKKARMILELSRVAAVRAIKRSGFEWRIDLDDLKDVASGCALLALEAELRGRPYSWKLYRLAAMTSLFSLIGRPTTGANKPTQYGKINGTLGRVSLEDVSLSTSASDPFVAIALRRLPQLWSRLTERQAEAFVAYIRGDDLFEVKDEKKSWSMRNNLNLALQKLRGRGTEDIGREQERKPSCGSGSDRCPDCHKRGSFFVCLRFGLHLMWQNKKIQRLVRCDRCIDELGKRKPWHRPSTRVPFFAGDDGKAINCQTDRTA